MRPSPAGTIRKIERSNGGGSRVFRSLQPPQPLFLLPAALFLAAIFGKPMDNRVTRLYDLTIHSFGKTQEAWRHSEGIHNIFRGAGRSSHLFLGPR